MNDKDLQYTSLKEIEAAFLHYVPKQSTKSRPYTLTKISALLKYLGNPHNDLRVVHIAGTSGKTSTSYFIRSLLEQAGAKTGLTVSPHITSIKERVQVNGDVLADEIYITYANRFLSLVRQSGIEPSFFEATMVFAFWVFREECVDYAVVETGMGGLLDGSNVTGRSDKIAIITDIGLDHTEILGETIEEIATQKAGIIHSKNMTFVIDQSERVLSAIQEYATKQDANLTVVRSIENIELQSYQKRNWSVARAAFDYISQRDHLIHLTDEQISLAMRQTPPGRLEKLEVAGKQIILDGAHNPQKLAALSGELHDIDMDSLVVVANFVSGPTRKIDDNVSVLSRMTHNLIIPEFMVVQDIGKQSMKAEEIAERAYHAGISVVEVKKELDVAIKSALDGVYSTVIITGSLYLVSQARSLLEKYR
jgi:dihydrofolate synthase/folylpolyglutamate synthase